MDEPAGSSRPSSYRLRVPSAMLDHGAPTRCHFCRGPGSGRPLRNFKTGLRIHLRTGNGRSPPLRRQVGGETRGARPQEVRPKPGPASRSRPLPLQLPDRRRPRGGTAADLAAQRLGFTGKRQGEGHVPARRIGNPRARSVPARSPPAAEPQVRPGVRSPPRACTPPGLSGRHEARERRRWRLRRSRLLTASPRRF